MKKFITMLLVGLLAFGSFSLVFAEEPNITQGENILEETQGPTRLDLLKEFNADIHKIDALRVERNQLQIQVVEKHDNLVDLIVQAKEAKNKEALQAAKETKQQLKGLNDEIKALHEQSKAAKEAFRTALKNKDKDKANTELQNLININTSINNKLQNKVQVLGAIVDILS